MQSVSRFEANLLRLLYYFLRREPPERALPLLEQRIQPPPCLSRTAVNLVQDALGKGCVFLLAQRGGWRRERHLRNERIKEGRLWERSDPKDLALSFSRHTLDFLLWVTAARPADKDGAWKPVAKELTLGDLLLLFFAHEGLRAAPEAVGGPALRARPTYATHGLCWLAYPEDYAGAPDKAAPDFAPWTKGTGAAMLEAMQFDLAARWVEVESGKERIIDPASMRALGEAQERVLTAFLDAVESAARLDLARFLLRAASALLGPHAHAGMWTGALQVGGLRVADRTAAYQAAAVFLRHLERLQRWERQARAIGYFDEGYAASQLWKSDWEAYEGDTLVARAQAIRHQLDPMHQG